MRMRQAGRWLSLFLLCSTTLAATPELRPFQASYSITRGKTQLGLADIQLQRLPDGHWSYMQRTQIRNFLARLFLPADQSSRSQFLLQDGKVVSQQYSVESSDKDENQSLTFDWSRNHVTGLFDGKPVDLQLQPGMLDSLTVQVALMNELAAGRSPQRFVLVEKGRIKEYAYTSEGSETLHTATGDYPTVIYRSSRQGSGKTTVFWCAPALGYLPLKVERRDGKDVEFTLTVASQSSGGA